MGFHKFQVICRQIYLLVIGHLTAPQMIFPDMVIMPFLVALISLKIEKVTQIVPVILPIIQILLAWSFSKIRMEY